MKSVILLTFITFAFAQMHNENPAGETTLHDLIRQEVQQILHNNHGIDVYDCVQMCDSLFDLNAGHDEGITDFVCRRECEELTNTNNNNHAQGHNWGQGN